jgi:thiol-disulfide isomerase/thioredoxin
MQNPNPNDPSLTPLQLVAPAEVSRRIAAGDTFVVNIVTAWCPDCSERQAVHIDGFVQKMQLNGIEVLQVNVQSIKGEFISAEHELLTAQFGGHGYPRTVLIHNGKVADQNNVEIITEDTLSALATKFMAIIAQS